MSYNTHTHTHITYFYAMFGSKKIWGKMKGVWYFYAMYGSQNNWGKMKGEKVERKIKRKEESEEKYKIDYSE